MNIELSDGTKEAIFIVGLVLVSIATLMLIIGTASYYSYKTTMNCRIEVVKAGVDVPSAIVLCKQ